jgi:hypothetical protein
MNKKRNNLGTRQNFTKNVKTGFGGTDIPVCVVLEHRFKPHRQECLCYRLMKLSCMKRNNTNHNQTRQRYAKRFARRNIVFMETFAGAFFCVDLSMREVN